MAYTLLSFTSASSAAGGTSTATTGNIDTTGADLVVVFSGGLSAATTIADSKVNTWLDRTTYGSTLSGRVSYYRGGSVGTGHNFSATGQLPCLAVLAFSGSAVSPYDTEGGGSTGGGTSQDSGGTVTPSETNCLFITGLTWTDSGNGQTVSSGFTPGAAVSATAASFGAAIAYEIQTSVVGRNPTWSVPVSGFMTVGTAVFKDTPGGGGGGTFPAPQLSQAWARIVRA